MTRFLVELKPERIEDIMAMIALYRPGPMANIPEYIARKKGRRKVKYYHPKMKSYLNKSFGILVYQDDLLFTAMELAGYDWKSVDKFRKAVGKKIPEEMARQHEIFVKGCVKHSKMTSEEAEGLWNLFEPFQGYGFNKAHAASYGLVAYQTSYMKANYPVEFMCALMTAEGQDKEKLSSAISECSTMGIKIYPPDINESGRNFNILKDNDSLDSMGIRFGLSAVKNVGKAALDEIIGERKRENYQNFADFLSRVDNRKVNKKVVESLIKAGALFSFGNRNTLLTKLDEMRTKIVNSNANKDQQNLFGSSTNNPIPSKIRYDELDEFDEDTIRKFERELLGFSLSDKPIHEILEGINYKATHKINDISLDVNFNETVTIAAVVSEVRRIITKTSGKEMAFVKAKDETGSIELVVFPNTYKETKKHWVENSPLIFSGKVNNREESVSIIVNQILNDDEDNNDNHVYIKLSRKTDADKLKKIRSLLTKNPGKHHVSLILNGNKTRKIDLGLRINWNKTLSKKISDILK